MGFLPPSTQLLKQLGVKKGKFTAPTSTTTGHSTDAQPQRITLPPPAPPGTSSQQGHGAGGAGDQPTLRLVGTPPGKWMTISVCDGIGVVWCALSDLNLPFVGWGAELDGDLRALVRQKHPAVQLWADCKSLKPDAIVKEANRNACVGILLTGGPPCQPFSQLGPARWDGATGFEDRRRRDEPLLYFAELREALASACAKMAPWPLHFRFFMEEVASMKKGDRARITELLGTPPVFLDGADWGVVRRPRLYWGLLEKRGDRTTGTASTRTSQRRMTSGS